MRIDVAGCLGCRDLALDGAHRAANGVVASKKQRRIQVALQHAGVNTACSGIHGHAVIHAHDLTASLRHRAEQLARSHAEVDARDAAFRGLQNLRGIRKHELAVVALIEVARPGIKKLHRIDARFHLQLQEVDDGRRQALHQCVPGLRLRMHKGLCLLVVLGRTTLHQVAGQGKWGADETDKRLGLGQLIQDDGDAIANLRNISVQDGQLGDVLFGAHWLFHHWPAARHDVHADASGLERHDDIAEQNRGINVVAAHRLQGDLSEQLRHEARVEHVDALPNLAVFRQGTPCLTHEPHGRTGRRAASGGIDERGVSSS